ncbi:MAG: hypothetical protein JNL98_26400 [Bryobacterales bacterium]|nr:hypothetical protein [Bryobacterales bacterium]
MLVKLGVLFLFVSAPLSAGDPSNIGAKPAYRPLTTAERWQLYQKSAFGAGSALRAAGTAAYDQYVDIPEEWGQGAAGYFRRFGSRAGRFTVQDSIEHSLAFGLKQDVRYERCTCSGFLQRTGHAVKLNFVTRNERGNYVPAVARAAGYFGGELSALAWTPPSYTYRDALLAGGGRYALGIGWNLLKEFWPEIRRPVAKAFGR